MTTNNSDDIILNKVRQGKPSDNLEQATHKIIDTINAHRREELLNIMNFKTPSVQQFMQELRTQKALKEYEKGNKSKTMRKVASMPQEVDDFFSKIYGPEYYKEKDFFTKYAPEWRVVDRE